ncbi:hypothetical protein C492_16558 [Natronococcus jeotgali DSM 18795]|uniref:Uncharacterized protein n=1 Tax=Natronococcus jeotgali DSM 18795 TaxID=1227498 RepID=L9WXR8_9EURY|nr:hypothetical protein C492_16558 [Natronococcus jeotgali DSM 18795]
MTMALEDFEALVDAVSRELCLVDEIAFRRDPPGIVAAAASLQRIQNRTIRPSESVGIHVWLL